MKPFVGRENELQRLEDLSKSGRACLAVIKGRRRIGKSRLAEEFGKDKFFCPLAVWLHSKEITAQDQKNAFAKVNVRLYLIFLLFLLMTGVMALFILSTYLTGKPTVILFDEISWMGSKDPTFVPKLKVWWDLVLQHHPSILLILCGSIRHGWIKISLIVQLFLDEFLYTLN